MVGVMIILVDIILTHFIHHIYDISVDSDLGPELQCLLKVKVDLS